MDKRGTRTARERDAWISVRSDDASKAESIRDADLHTNSRYRFLHNQAPHRVESVVCVGARTFACDRDTSLNFLRKDRKTLLRAVLSLLGRNVLARCPVIPPLVALRLTPVEKKNKRL